ncbi:hypothetical protein B7494_g2190 [Chlorociboria aeruginascens]|nr:hypothetical protein B7494_g2190 [Chlorociboria aeruginascens]
MSQSLVTPPLPKFTISDQFLPQKTDRETIRFLRNPDHEHLLTIDDPERPGIGTTITYYRLVQCLKPNHPIEQSILEAYFRLLCKHFNAHSAPWAPTSLPPHITFPASFWDRTFNIDPRFQNRSGRDKRHLTAYLKKIYGPPLYPDSKTTKESRRVSLLNDVRKILLPVERNARGLDNPLDGMTVRTHAGVIIVSPIDRTVEYMDSLHYTGAWYFHYVFQSLIYEFRELFRIHEWKWRERNCPIQIDKRIPGHGAFDCSVHTMTNATNALFGFDYVDNVETEQELDVEGNVIMNWVYGNWGGKDILAKRTRIITALVRNKLEFPGYDIDGATAAGIKNEKDLSEEAGWITLTRQQLCAWDAHHGKPLPPRTYVMLGDRVRPSLFGLEPEATVIDNIAKEDDSITLWKILKIFGVKDRRDIINARGTLAEGWTKEMVRRRIYMAFAEDGENLALWNNEP